MRTKVELFRVLRGEDADSGTFVSEADERTIEVHLGNLRRKLGEDPRSPRWIQTVRGVGYRTTAAPVRQGQRRANEQGWSGRACSPGLAERGGGPIHEQRQLLNRLRGETAQRRHDVRHARLTRLAEAGVGPASEFVEQLPRQGGHGGGAGHHR